MTEFSKLFGPHSGIVRILVGQVSTLVGLLCLQLGCIHSVTTKPQLDYSSLRDQ